MDVSIKIYLRNALTLFKAVAIVIIPVQVLSALVTASTLPHDLAQMWQSSFQFQPPPPEQPFPTFTTDDLRTQIGGNVVVLVLTLVSGALATGACFKIVGSAYLGESTDWRSSLEFAARRIHSLLWVTVLTSLGIFAGFLLCLIPGIWLYAAWSVAIPALLTEDARGTKALGRSHRLVKNRWWITALIVLLANLIVAVVQGIAGGVFNFVIFTDLGRSFTTLLVFGAIGGTISSILGTPLLAAMLTVLYVDLRVRKEGFDLQLLAERIGGGAPGGPPTDLLPPPPPDPHAWQPPPPPGYEGAQPPPPPGHGAGGDATPGDRPPYWPPPPGWRPPPREPPR